MLRVHRHQGTITSVILRTAHRYSTSPPKFGDPLTSRPRLPELDLHQHRELVRRPMRQFLLKVHPDFFKADPIAQTVNSASVRELLAVSDSMFPSESNDDEDSTHSIRDINSHSAKKKINSAAVREFATAKKQISLRFHLRRNGLSSNEIQSSSSSFSLSKSHKNENSEDSAINHIIKLPKFHPSIFNKVRTGAMDTFLYDGLTLSLLQLFHRAGVEVDTSACKNMEDRIDYFLRTTTTSVLATADDAESSESILTSMKARRKNQQQQQQPVFDLHRAMEESLRSMHFGEQYIAEMVPEDVDPVQLLRQHGHVFTEEGLAPLELADTLEELEKHLTSLDYLAWHEIPIFVSRNPPDRTSPPGFVIVHVGFDIEGLTKYICANLDRIRKEHLDFLKSSRSKNKYVNL